LDGAKILLLKKPKVAQPSTQQGIESSYQTRTAVELGAAQALRVAVGAGVERPLPTLLMHRVAAWYSRNADSTLQHTLARSAKHLIGTNKGKSVGMEGT
jgi:hypothetical protein